MVSVLDSHASDPGSNLTSSTNCLFFTEIFKKLALLARPILKSFLKFPCQELSEYVVGSSGGLHFTRLDSGEQCSIIKVIIGEVLTEISKCV